MEFCWDFVENLNIFPKIWKRTSFFDKLIYIHTQYWDFLNLNLISFNFCSYFSFRLKPRYGVLLNFCWNLDHFLPKTDNEHFCWQTNIHTYSILTFLNFNFDHIYWRNNKMKTNHIFSSVLVLFLWCIMSGNRIL